jgi:hypothetical protein
MTAVTSNKEKALEYFKEKYRLLLDNFGEEKHWEEIEYHKIVIRMLEKEIRNDGMV